MENKGWSVFWDRTNLLAGQDVDETIEQEIEQAGCMIVAWSKAAKKSDWVRGEATIAREQKKILPIKFELVTPPIAFRAIHTDDLINWDGDPDNEDFKKLLRSVTRLVSLPITKNEQRSSVQAKVSNSASASKRVPSHSKATNKSKPTFIEPEMVVIPTGHFQMGGVQHHDEKPMHTVYFSKPFLIAKHLVTFDQFDLFALANKRQMPKDESWGRGQCPVINVSWDDACDYANWLSKLSGKPYRLASEAEWEYAARANTTSEYYWGNKGKAKDFAWFDKNSKDITHPVAEKKPNAFGLYDMFGNVWEWTQDYWHENYHEAPNDGTAWELENVGYRVLRGGSSFAYASNLRSAFRYRLRPSTRSRNIGFRLARD